MDLTLSTSPIVVTIDGGIELEVSPSNVVTVEIGYGDAAANAYILGLLTNNTALGRLSDALAAIDALTQAEAENATSDVVGLATGRRLAQGAAVGDAAHVAAGDPHTQYQKKSEKDAAGGYAGLDGSTLVNPAVLSLTTLGDLFYRGASALTRIAIGSTGQALTVVGGVPAWAASATSVLTATGDILYASAANTLARLAAGTTHHVLTIAGGVPTWAAGSKATLTTTGDLLYASAANTLARLGIGAAGTVLRSNGAGQPPTWGKPRAYGIQFETTTNVYLYGMPSVVHTAVGTANSGVLYSSAVPVAYVSRGASANASMRFSDIIPGNGGLHRVCASVQPGTATTGSSNLGWSTQIEAAFGAGTNGVALVANNTTYGDVNLRLVYNVAGSVVVVADLGITWASLAASDSGFITLEWDATAGTAVVRNLSETILAGPYNIPSFSGRIMDLGVASVGGAANSGVLLETSRTGGSL